MHSSKEFKARNTDLSMPGPGSPTVALGARWARYIVKCAPPMPGDMMCAVCAFDLHRWNKDCEHGRQLEACAPVHTPAQCALQSVTCRALQLPTILRAPRRRRGSRA